MHFFADSLLTVTSISAKTDFTMKTLVAKSTVTGLYFKGTNFSAKSIDEAMELRPGTTADSFRPSWGGGVEVINLKEMREQSPNYGMKSFAQLIHEGELDPFSAARAYVKIRNHAGQRSFSIRTASGEYVSRVVKLEKTGLHRHAFINFCGNEVVVVWSRGELAVEWAA
jgi:hypothetical protein